MGPRGGDGERTTTVGIDHTYTSDLVGTLNPLSARRPARLTDKPGQPERPIRIERRIPLDSGQSFYSL